MGRLTHVALFTWKPGTTDAQIGALTDALNALRGVIPEIRSFRVGPDAGVSTGNDAYAVVATFDDIDGFRRYAADPRHLDIIERLVAPIRATRHAVQFV